MSVCKAYTGLCKVPYNILDPCHFKFVQEHKGASVNLIGNIVTTNYLANTSITASPGFRVLIKTVCGQKYRLTVTSQLLQGDTAFVYVEDCKTTTRLVPRTFTWTQGAGSITYNIDFTAIDSFTYVGILFLCPDVTYSLETTQFILKCQDKICPTGPTGPMGPTGPDGPVTCEKVIECICDVEECIDEYTYEICLQFLQTSLDFVNAAFLNGTEISILAYRLNEGNVANIGTVGPTGPTGPAIIGTVPVTFAEVRAAFVQLEWQIQDLITSEFVATLPEVNQIISHVLIDNSLAMGPPFSVNLMTNCTQIDGCATKDPENRLLIKQPDDSLCWANICPPQIETCVTTCDANVHVGILPEESLGTDTSLSVGPRGTGFLSAQKPTPGAIEGGDCRGSRAVDLQMLRSAPSQVAGSNYGVIAGGQNNALNEIGDNANAANTVISGGNTNTIVATGDDSTVMQSVISGGGQNIIDAKNANADASFATISGGQGNQIYAYSSVNHAVISGGQNNMIMSSDLFGNSRHSVISGGIANQVRYSLVSTISGGTGSFIQRSDYSTIGGGSNNYINSSGDPYTTNNNSTIGGGLQNQIKSSSADSSTSRSTIGGGSENVIEASYNSDAYGACISGGGKNRIRATSNDAIYTVIPGGNENEVHGGSYSTISGGKSNRNVSSNYNTILGGLNNSCTGADFSIVGGRNSTCTHNDCFVFGNGAESTGNTQVVFLPVPTTPIANGLNVVTNNDGLIGVGAAQRGCPVFYLNYTILGPPVAPCLNWCDPSNDGNLDDNPGGLSDAVAVDVPGYVAMDGDLVIVIHVNAADSFLDSCMFKRESGSWSRKRIKDSA